MDRIDSKMSATEQRDGGEAAVGDEPRRSDKKAKHGKGSAVTLEGSWSSSETSCLYDAIFTRRNILFCTKRIFVFKTHVNCGRC